MTIQYLNGFNPLTHADDYDGGWGDTVVEVWDTYPQFNKASERTKYFQGEHDYHCLKADMNNINGEWWLEFYYDDEPVGLKLKVLPSEEGLADLFNLYG